MESCLGKILERVITNRYTDVVLARIILPDTQFSAPGRSCPQALEYLLAIVYRGWCPGQRQAGNSRYVSMMTLDMTGAFNRVPHAKLLEVLESMGIPAWLVNITRSFLSCRSTKLAMPGYLSGLYFVNIGVPQGSPLSPILFALFTAGLLKRLETTTVLRSVDPCAEKFVFAYADDNHIMIISKSFKLNCLAFQALHPVIMEWAEEHGASFGPSKYHVMHFLPPGMSFSCPSDHRFSLNVLRDAELSHQGGQKLASKHRRTPQGCRQGCRSRAGCDDSLPFALVPSC